MVAESMLFLVYKDTISVKFKFDASIQLYMSYQYRNPIYVYKNTISHKPCRVSASDFFHLIVDPKLFSMMPCSKLETNLELCSTALKSCYFRNKRIFSINGYISRTYWSLDIGLLPCDGKP